MSVNARWSASIASCACGHHNPITLDTIVVEKGALDLVAGYLTEQNYRQVALVVDENTYKAAGEKLLLSLHEADITATFLSLKADSRGDVVADEGTLVQILLDIPQQSTDVIIAVGSGTIHDLVRFAAFKMGKPFLSIPTAPSVDGFTSVGAPLIIKGVKTTIPAIAPSAIFADLNVLMEAPRSLVSAGFGDMLGKYTSLFDWRFSNIAAQEPYCPVSAEMTREALSDCIRHADDIAERNENGIRVLMNALIQSGIAMLLFGQSHPASGSEHHLSHYWEMEYLKLGRKQLLHGAKVGIACAQISQLYHHIVKSEHFLKVNSVEEQYSPALASIRSNWEHIAKLVEHIPSPDIIRSLLERTGGPSTPEAIGISEELLKRSLLEAHKVRNRYTMLKAYNELGHTLLSHEELIEVPVSGEESSDTIIPKENSGSSTGGRVKKSIIPILRIFDEEKAKDFYLRYLDMHLDWEHRFEPGMPLYMQVSDGEGRMIHLSEHHGDCSPGAAIRIEVENVRAMHAQLHTKAYKYARPGVEETPWDTLEMCIQDPFGNRVIFYQD
ncbi:MAG: glycerol-phosphate dehydrogenase [Paenibacillus sp.]|nr:glycerol-phosphate dehydrogenase [Paenibacillus sp.]